MGQKLEACLVLGCNGLRGEDGFLSCSGVTNSIIELSLLEDGDYERILDFLENACDLFSSPINDYNKCVNCLSLLYQNYHAYDQATLHNIQFFLKMHRNCGIWLMLIMKEDLSE